MIDLEGRLLKVKISFLFVFQLRFMDFYTIDSVDEWMTPDDWWRADVLSVFKKGVKEDPFSLTSKPVKLQILRNQFVSTIKTIC